MNRRFYKKAGLIAALAGMYFCAGKFAVSLAVVNPGFSPVWPPAGLALAALLLGGSRLWPGIFIGAFLVSITTHGSVATSLGIAGGNTVEALAGAWLANRFAGGVKAFERAHTVFRFVLLAAGLSAVISASLGVAGLCLSGSAPWSRYGTIWLTWWLSDIVGTLVVAPLLVIWLTGFRLRWKPKRLLEGAALLATLIYVGCTVFWQNTPFGAAEQLWYLSIPLLLLAAFRFEVRGAVTAAFLMSGIALWGTMHRLGPFATMPDRNQSFLLLQVFVAVITTTVLVLAAVIAERRKFEQRLQVKDAISRVLAEATTRAEAAPRILQALCEWGGWDVGVFWNVDRAANELVCAGVWHDPSLALPAFEAATRHCRLAPAADLPGRVWNLGQSEWIADLSRGQRLPRDQAALKDGLRSALAFPIKLNDKILGVIECFSRQIFRPDAEFLQMLADVGNQVGQFMERKRAEQSARDSRERFQQMAENIREVFWMTDTETARTFLYVSPAYEEIWGRTCESLYASPGDWMEAIHPEDRERVRQAAHAKQSVGTYDEMYRILRPDGAMRWIHDRAFPVRDESGRVSRIVGVAEDITGRKLAEARLLMLVSAVESTGELICTTDLQDRFTFVNRAFLQAYGYTLSEILGQTPEMLWSPKNPPGLTAEILEQTRRGGWRGEVLNRRKDGSEFTVFLSTSQIQDGNGQVIGLMGVAHDVTEQRRLEKEILDISARERQRIGYELHDGLGQHLAGIAYKTKSLEVSLEHNAAASAAAREIVELVNDAMRQTRQLARSFDPVEVEASGLIAALERLAADTRKNFPVECRFFCRESSLALPPRTGFALFQIAQEAVRNALVHGGAERIDLIIVVDRRQLHLKIRDYGKGFEPARQQSASGLGLRIMRYRASSIGGVINISSRPGASTVVECSVPLPATVASPDLKPLIA